MLENNKVDALYDSEIETVFAQGLHPRAFGLLLTLLKHPLKFERVTTDQQLYNKEK